MRYGEEIFCGFRFAIPSSIPSRSQSTLVKSNLRGSTFTNQWGCKARVQNETLSGLSMLAFCRLNDDFDLNPVSSFPSNLTSFRSVEWLKSAKASKVP